MRRAIFTTAAAHAKAVKGGRSASRARGLSSVVRNPRDSRHSGRRNQTGGNNKRYESEEEAAGKARLQKVSEELAQNPDSKAATVIIKRDKARLFKWGHPLVYGGAVDRVEGKNPEGGEVVMVTTASKEPLGWGVFNPNSMYRVRMMQQVQDVGREPNLALNLPELLKSRLESALALRTALGLPSVGGTDDVSALSAPGGTTAYRLINAEGDRLSGLIADRYGEYIVVASSALWVEQQRELVTELLLQAVPGVTQVVWRSQEILKLEGIDNLKEEQDVDDESDSDISEDNSSTTESMENMADVQVVENGVKYWVGLMSQKTGFYCDQRDSRVVLRSLAAGKRVLDCCCYTGGFSLSAALGGATQVVGVDSSKDALARAQANAVLNGVDDVCEFEPADVKKYLANAVNNGDELFDIIILDPPKLAPTRSVVTKAKRHYQKLNSLAMKLLKPGGLLMTCSCSGAITQSGDFENIVSESAQMAGRSVTYLRHAGPAPDHTINPAYPEGKYLTNLLVYVH